MAQLFVMVGLWLILLFYIWKGLKANSGKKYTDEELLLLQPKSKPEEFPEYYSTLHGLCLFSFLIFSLVAMFGFAIIVGTVQKLLYGRGDTIIFSAANTIPISCVPSLFLGMVGGAFSLKYLAHFYPKFDQYQALKDRINQNAFGLSKKEKNAIFEDSLCKVNMEKLAASEWRLLFIGAFIIWIIVGPVYILAMDYYTKFTSQGLAVNTFLDLKERYYKWSDIASAKIYATTAKGERGKKIFNPKFEIITTDKAKITIWDRVGWGSPSPKELIRIVSFLKSKGIMINIDPLTAEQEEALSRYNQKAISEVHSIFNYSQGK